MTAKKFAWLICLGIISLILLVALFYAQMKLQYFLLAGGLWTVQPIEPVQALLSAALYHLPMLLYPAFALLYAFVVCKTVGYPKKMRLIIVNSVVFCAIALLVNIMVFQLRLPLPYSLETYLYLPANILCILVTQVIFALLFLRKKHLLEKKDTEEKR